MRTVCVISYVDEASPEEYENLSKNQLKERIGFLLEKNWVSNDLDTPLLECPCCGEDAPTSLKRNMENYFDRLNQEYAMVKIQCQRCGIQVTDFLKDAVKKWNTRITPGGRDVDKLLLAIVNRMSEKMIEKDDCLIFLDLFDKYKKYLDGGEFLNG